MTWVMALAAVSFNIFAAKHLPLFEGVILFFNIIGFFAVCIPLWVLAPKAPSSEVWGKFYNGGGWSSTGVAAVVGILAPSGAFIGADSAAHMSEETKNASITVPRMMQLTIIINGVLGWIMAITYCYVIQDLQEQIVQSDAVFPFVGVFAVGTGSQAGAIGMTVPIIVLQFAMCLNATAAGSRQAWSFARDEGLPFSSFFRKVRIVSGTPLPINAMVFCESIVFALGLLSLGGSEVFNSIAGLVSGAVGLTYGLSIGCVLWRRIWGAPLPHARWSLGRLGVPFNALAFFFQIFVVIISFFPLFAKVNAAAMNWGIAMFAGAAVIAVVDYVVRGRHVYKGPVVHIKHE